MKQILDKSLILKIKKLICEAGKIALFERDNGLHIEYKKNKSPFTNADIKVSEFIFDALSKLTPSIPIICEERKSRKCGKLFWSVDPIDSTKSFIRGMGSFTINIGLVYNEQPIYGFIYQPTTKILYFTDENKKFCKEINNLPVIAQHKHDGLIAVISANSDNHLTNKFLEKYSLLEVKRISSSLKFCLIAEGKADIYPRFGETSQWDIVAGDAIIRASGGIVKDLSDKDIRYNSENNFINPHFIAKSALYKSSIISV